MRACVRACVRACERACVCVCVLRGKVRGEEMKLYEIKNKILKNRNCEEVQIPGGNRIYIYIYTIIRLTQCLKQTSFDNSIIILSGRELKMSAPTVPQNRDRQRGPWLDPQTYKNIAFRSVDWT